MTMTVMPNSDGTYTVRCNGVEVIVGKKPAEANGNVDFSDVEEPDAIIWPDDPEPNDGGVHAYVMAGRSFHNAIPLRSSDELLALVEREVRSTAPFRAGRRLCVFVSPIPEAELDLEALFAPLGELAGQWGLRIELYLSAMVLRGEAAG